MTLMDWAAPVCCLPTVISGCVLGSSQCRSVHINKHLFGGQHILISCVTVTEGLSYNLP